jgi:hypothetical protein
MRSWHCVVTPLSFKRTCRVDLTDTLETTSTGSLGWSQTMARGISAVNAARMCVGAGPDTSKFLGTQTECNEETGCTFPDADPDAGGGFTVALCFCQLDVDDSKQFCNDGDFFQMVGRVFYWGIEIRMAGSYTADTHKTVLPGLPFSLLVVCPPTSCKNGDPLPAIKIVDGFGSDACTLSHSADVLITGTTVEVDNTQDVLIGYGTTVVVRGRFSSGYLVCIDTTAITGDGFVPAGVIEVASFLRVGGEATSRTTVLTVVGDTFAALGLHTNFSYGAPWSQGVTVRLVAYDPAADALGWNTSLPNRSVQLAAWENVCATGEV